MNFRDLISKIAEAEQAAAPAQAAWTPSPEQTQWLGGANQQDPYILSRMPGQKPPVSWFKDPADQALAKRMGFPEAPAQAAAPAGTTQPSAQSAADAQGKQLALEKLKQLNALLAKLKPGEKRTVDQLKTTQDIAKSGLEESIDAEIAKQLIESFGYTQEQLDELSMQDVGDFGRGAWQGATLGTGSNIAAGAKSLFKGTKYKDELSAELAANKAAQERSPLAYGAGNVAGAVGSSFAIPGAGLGNLAARGAAKLGAGAATQALTKGATMVGANLALQKGIDTAVGAHNKDVLGTDQKTQAQAGAKPSTTQPNYDDMPFGQAFAAARKAGLKQFTWKGKPYTTQTASESMSSLREKLAVLEAEQQTDEGVWDTLATAGGKLAKGVAQGFKNPGVRNIPNLATAQRVGANIGVAGKNIAGAASKAGSAVTGAAKAAGGAMARNPVKTALGTAGAAYGASQVGGGQTGQQAAGAKPGTTSGKKPTAPAAGLDPEVMAQINQLMSELSQFEDPEIQQGLVQARQALSQLSGDKNIGSADATAQPQQQQAAAPAGTSQPTAPAQATQATPKNSIVSDSDW